MSSVAAMFVIVGVLALVLLALFTGLWLKDRDRSQEEALDPERMDTQPERQPDRTG